MTDRDARVIAKYLTGLPVQCRIVRESHCLFVAGNHATRWFGPSWDAALLKLSTDLQVPRPSPAEVIAASTDDVSGSPSPEGVAGDNDTTNRSDS